MLINSNVMPVGGTYRVTVNKFCSLEIQLPCMVCNYGSNNIKWMYGEVNLCRCFWKLTSHCNCWCRGRSILAPQTSTKIFELTCRHFFYERGSPCVVDSTYTLLWDWDFDPVPLQVTQYFIHVGGFSEVSKSQGHNWSCEQIMKNLCSFSVLSNLPGCPERICAR